MRSLKKIYIALVLIFMYAPIVVLVIFSFNAAGTRGVFTGFSLRWYEELFNDRSIMLALYNTLFVAFTAAIVSTIIGTAAALGINAMKKKPRKLILALNNIPVLNPDIVAGLSLMLLYLFIYRVFGFMRMGLGTLLLSHITFNIPYVVLSVLPKIRQLDKHMYEAAQDLGATPFYALTRIVLPQLLPGIITGAVFAFTLSLDDFVISFFTKGAGVANLSVVVYTYAAKGKLTPKINALSTLMFTVVLMLLFLINRRGNSDERKRKKKEAMFLSRG